MKVCRVMLVDDHAVFRETLAVGINHLSAAHDGQKLRVVAEAGSTGDCLQQLTQIDVDVLVLDLSLPGRGGADLVSQIKRRFDAVQI